MSATQTRISVWHQAARTLLIGMLASGLIGGGLRANLAQAHTAALQADRIADRILGQPDCTSTVANNPAPPIGGLSARSLNIPLGVAVDNSSGRLYVADTFNNRVLSWSSGAAFETGQAADLVLGQPNFTTAAELPPTASRLNKPIGLAVDLAGNLYVADQSNHRVVVFYTPAATDTTADRVYGQQGDFTSSEANRGGIGAASLNAPRGVAVVGNLWVVIADAGNHRVLIYPTTTLTATRVLGQPGFTTSDIGTSENQLFDPMDVVVSSSSQLFVSDQGNHRVLRFDQPFTDDTSADGVLGQADFTGNLENRGAFAPNASSLWAPADLALDGSGRLLVADSLNNRVLVYENAGSLANGGAASQAYGQPSLVSGDENFNGPSASSLAWANGVTIDSTGRLYVADTGNHRLLAYDVISLAGCQMLYLPSVRR